MSQIKIAGACLNQTPIDWQNNTSNILEAISRAKLDDVELLCLPELCITAYGCQDLFLSNWVLQESLVQLKLIASHCKSIAVAVGLPIKFEENIYNVSCLIENQEIQGFYAKQILANEGIHYEHRWFKPWTKQKVDTIELEGKTYPIGDLTYHVKDCHVGFEICEDAWQPDRPACRLFEKGVELILNPSASHFAFDKYRTRVKLITESSEKFNCHYLYVNQLGNESGRVIYDGDILIAHQGNLLASQSRLSFNSIEMMSLDINTKSNSAPPLKIDFPSRNNEFSKAASLGLFDYLRKSGAKGYTLSLSGGADSSSIAVLVAEMVKNGIDYLGIEQFCSKIHPSITANELSDPKEVRRIITNQILFTAYQGTKNSSQDTLNSAKGLANSLGAQFSHWNIDEVVKSNHDIIESVLDRQLDWDTDDIALQNIQARTRSPLIWMMANINQSILLTTSNRSEGDVGYTTMDGDTSGSLAPIAGVDKPFIIQWLKYAEMVLEYDGLSYVNSLTPTAELRPKEFTQTDEDDLMPYELLLQIEKLAIHKRKSPMEVFETLSQTSKLGKGPLKFNIKKFFRMWSYNQWKRERLAPSFHLDEFNVDPKTWCRFPILSGSFTNELIALDRI